MQSRCGPKHANASGAGQQGGRRETAASRKGVFIAAMTTFADGQGCAEGAWQLGSSMLFAPGCERSRYLHATLLSHPIVPSDAGRTCLLSAKDWLPGYGHTETERHRDTQKTEREGEKKQESEGE